MTQRRVLVIGSQCEALQELSCISNSARRLYQVLTDEEHGTWVPAVPNGSLLIDKPLEVMHNALEAAFRRASENGATLLIAFVGHGRLGVGREFYFMTTDSPTYPDSRNAVQLVPRLREIYNRHNDIDGLLILLDTCYAGKAARDAAVAWVNEVDFISRFEILTATGSDEAYDCCFTETLIQVLENGLTNSEYEKYETVRCEYLVKIVASRCVRQDKPVHMTLTSDPGLFLAKNIAWRTTLTMSARSEIERFTADFHPTGNLSLIVKASLDHRSVAVVGEAGRGKTALMAALARPDITEGRVPSSFVQAITFITEATDAATLSDELSSQLRRTVAGFEDALETYQSNATLAELNSMDAMQQSVLEPLKRISSSHSIRIVVDGLDGLPESARQSVYRALDELSLNEHLDHVRLVMACRPGTKLPNGTELVTIADAEDKDLDAYLQKHGIESEEERRMRIREAAGSWLIARLQAELYKRRS